MRLYLLALAAIVAACQDYSAIHQRREGAYGFAFRHVEPLAQDDVLVVIDNGGSLDPELVAQHLASLRSATGSYRVALVPAALPIAPPHIVDIDDLARAALSECDCEGAACPPCANEAERWASEITQAIVPTGPTHPGLAAAAAALDDMSWRRAGAALVLVFITDRDDCSMLSGASGACDGAEGLAPLEDLVARLAAYVPRAVAVFGSRAGDDCAPAPSTRYNTLAEASAHAWIESVCLPPRRLPNGDYDCVSLPAPPIACTSEFLTMARQSRFAAELGFAPEPVELSDDALWCEDESFCSWSGFAGGDVLEGFVLYDALVTY